MVFKENAKLMLFGIQISIVGLAALQFVAVYDALFPLFLTGLVCVGVGTVLTVVGIARK